MSINDLLNQLEDAEKRFVGTEFLAPIIDNRGAAVAVRIAGVVCRLSVSQDLPRRFRGWALLRALSTSQAAFVRPAALGEIAAVLALFPRVPVVLVHKEGPTWLALAANSGDGRFNIKGLVPVQLAEEGLERFETVVTRFDGTRFWYAQKDPTRTPALAAYLRDQLTPRGAATAITEPSRLQKSGLSAEERAAFALARAVALAAARSSVEERLAEALAHAGSELRSFVERAEAYVVTYVVDGRQHVSTINREDLSVITAGVCLAGQDRQFDLTSLVGVLREGANEGDLVWVGQGGLPEDQYWQIHPPRNSD